MARSSDGRPAKSVMRDAEDLAKEMTHDAIRAARIGYRLASRATKKALEAVEQAANELK